jgi:hypothetical protein
MTNSELRFGKDAHPILRELQSRIDAMPKESLNFVAAMMADGVITTPPLSDLIFGMIYIRNGISIEPIHQALTTVVALRNQHGLEQAKLRDDKLAFVFACGGRKAADGALQFVVELQTLLEAVK